jgi:MFS family permease
MMIIFMVLMGVMGGGYHPSSTPLVSVSVEPKNRGRALGIHQIGGGASYFLAPLIAVAITTALGWRGVYIVVSVPTIIFGIVLYVLLSRLGYAKKPRQRITSHHTGASLTTEHLRRLIPFFILAITFQVFIYSITSFIPLFIVDQFDASEETAAALLALTYSGGLWAGPLGGYLSDRLGRIPVMLIMSLFASIIIYMLNLASLGWSISVLLFVIGTSMFITMPVAEAYIVSQSSERNLSTILGIYYFASRGGQGAIQPVLGYLIDRAGFQTTYTLMSAGLFMVTIGCSMFLWRNKD